MIKNQNIDTIITLGLRLDKDGRPEPELLRRIREAVDLAKFCIESLGADSYPWLIMSGGKGESAVMKQAAMDLAMPEDCILEEDQSLCTWGNALFSHRLARLIKAQHVALVSSGYHLPPALVSFKHVIAGDYKLSVIPSDNQPITPEQIAYQESCLARSADIIARSKPGNIQAIEAALINHVPDYSELFAEPWPQDRPLLLPQQWLPAPVLV